MQGGQVTKLMMVNIVGHTNTQGTHTYNIGDNVVLHNLFTNPHCINITGPRNKQQHFYQILFILPKQAFYIVELLVLF